MVVKKRLISESLNLSGICELTKGTTVEAVPGRQVLLPALMLLFFPNVA